MPIKYTIAGWRMFDTKITKHIVKLSPSGRYWYREPPSAKRAVGSAASLMILSPFQIEDGIGTPKKLTKRPKIIANIKGFLNAMLKT